MCRAEPLQQVFVSFALFGKGLLPQGAKVSKVKMDSKAFAKLMKEAGMMEGKLNLTRVDLCFTKFCNKVCFIMALLCMYRQDSII
jgi:hypothetical protein